jgi:hypothetical protein
MFRRGERLAPFATRINPAAHLAGGIHLADHSCGNRLRIADSSISPEATGACNRQARAKHGHCWGSAAMGHTRLGDLPRTRKWQDVVSLIAGGAGAAQIANGLIRAADRGLQLATEHKALVEAFWLLTQLPIAAKERDLAAALRERGLRLADSPGLMDVVAAVSEAVDERLPNNAGRTDLGEMAQAAASEAIVQVVTERTQSLFGTTPEDVKTGLARLGTVKQFGAFARQFYARLTEKVLQYYVSRATASHVGGQELRFPTLAAKAEFDKALALHCREASKIVETFAGEWFSKTKWVNEGMSRDDAARFAHVAMRKMVDELKAGAR